MWFLFIIDNDWETTDKGAKFSMWHKGVLNSDSWHLDLVDAIIKYLKDNRISLTLQIVAYSTRLFQLSRLNYSKKPGSCWNVLRKNSYSAF